MQVDDHSSVGHHQEQQQQGEGALGVDLGFVGMFSAEKLKGRISESKVGGSPVWTDYRNPLFPQHIHQQQQQQQQQQGVEGNPTAAAASGLTTELTCLNCGKSLSLLLQVRRRATLPPHIISSYHSHMDSAAEVCMQVQTADGKWRLQLDFQFEVFPPPSRFLFFWSRSTPLELRRRPVTPIIGWFTSFAARMARVTSFHSSGTIPSPSTHLPLPVSQRP